MQLVSDVTMNNKRHQNTMYYTDRNVHTIIKYVQYVTDNESAPYDVRPTEFKFKVLLTGCNGTNDLKSQFSSQREKYRVKRLLELKCIPN